MAMSDEHFQNVFRPECDAAVKRIIAGEPDKSDFMIPLERIVNPDSHPPLMIECLDAVCTVTGHSAAQIRGVRRMKQIGRARAMFCLLVRERCTNKTDTDIGQMIHKDRTSVIHAWQRGMRLRDTDAEFAMDYRRALAMVG